jgi:hypothetical protein
MQQHLSLAKVCFCVSDEEKKVAINIDNRRDKMTQVCNGATTLSIATFSLMTLSIVYFCDTQNYEYIL